MHPHLHVDVENADSIPSEKAFIAWGNFKRELPCIQIDITEISLKCTMVLVLNICSLQSILNVDSSAFHRWPPTTLIANFGWRLS